MNKTIQFFGGRIWRGVSSLLGMLFVLVLTAGIILNSFASEINVLLGVETSLITKAGGDMFQADYSSLPEFLDAKYQLIREISAEGSVLLKNNGALPLNKNERNVTVLGSNSVNMAYAGASGGSSFDTGKGNPAQILDLKTCFEDPTVGLRINPKMYGFYQQVQNSYRRNTPTSYFASGYTSVTIGEAPVSIYPADNGFPDYADAAIVVITRQGAEGFDLPFSPEYITDSDEVHYALELHDNERAVIALAEEHFDKVIVLVNSDNVMAIDELEADDGVDAILWIGSPGIRGLKGVGDILVGNVSPSGRLVDTYAANLASAPAMQNYGIYSFANEDSFTVPVKQSSKYVVEAEGIYIGYRYYETRYEDCVLDRGGADSAAGSSTGVAWNYADEVTYPFGYGLSYTEFSQTLDKVQVKDGVATATVTVKNIGNAEGKEVVELYLQTPYLENGIEKPAIQLAAFGKTDTLKPGKRETLTISFDLRYAASYDYRDAKTYILEGGDYYFAIGRDAHDALNNVLASKKAEATLTDAKGNAVAGQADKTVKVHLAEDRTTYAVSTAGYEITNLFDSADLNSYLPGSVTYLSRSAWDTTYPRSYEGLEATVAMQTDMADDEYIPGSEDTSGIKRSSTDTALTFFEMRDKEYEDPAWEDLISQLTLKIMGEFLATARTDIMALPEVSFSGTKGRDGCIGIEANYLAKWTDGLNIEEDSGVAYTELRGIAYPSAVVQASTWSEELITRQGILYGNDGILTGYSWQRAPGCNLHRTAFSGRNFEYFSEDPMLTFWIGAWQCAAAESKGLIMSPKHLAFNDQEYNRVGLCTFFNEQAAREIYLRAFEGAFTVGGARGTMSSYNRIGCIPASSSYALNTELLRNEWGFRGIVITDFLTSNNYVNGYTMLMAGTNCVCSPNSNTYAGKGQVFATASLKRDAQLLLTARERTKEMLYTFVHSIAANGYAEDSEVVSVTPWWQTAFLTADVVLGVLAAGSILLHIFAFRSGRREKTT